MKKNLTTYEAQKRGYAPSNVVPPSKFITNLTVFISAIMAFLASFALVLVVLSSTLIGKWQDALDGSATIRIPAIAVNIDTKVKRVMDILETTSGLKKSEVVSLEKQKGLLAPWFGLEGDLEILPLPKLITLTQKDATYDEQGLKLRLAAEVPEAVLDDHTHWRQSLLETIQWLRLLGFGSFILIMTSMAAIIVLTINTSVFANIQTLQVLRHIGAENVYIVRAFTSRFIFYATGGAFLGTAIAILCLLLLLSFEIKNPFLDQNIHKNTLLIWPLTIPPLCGLITLITTRLSAFHLLKDIR